MSKKKETLADYEIGNLVDFDFFKIFNILLLKEKKQYHHEELQKKFVNTLFTPLCSYAIEYLNNHDEKKGVIGTSTLDETKIIYLVLNQTVYDLFFRRTKGKIFAEGENEIDYDIKYNEENYIRFPIKEKDYYLEDLQKMVRHGVEIKDETKDNLIYLNEVFNNKRREIISSFRFGYAIQERIISTLFSSSDKKLKELPNVIFYKKKDNKNKIDSGKHNKDYNEVDRIVFVDENEDVKISNFMVYLKTEFRQGKNDTETFEEGETLVLPKHSLNFIEVKTSANYFKEKETNKEFELKSGTSSEISSSSSSNKIFYAPKKDDMNNSQKKNKDNSTKMAKEIIRKINDFCALFTNINIKYSQINLIIVIDSYFQKDFIDLAKKFSENLAAYNPTNLTLFFVHIENDITYISESSKYNKLNEDFNGLKKEFEDKEKKNSELIKDLNNRIENQEKDFQKKYENQKKDFQKIFQKKDDDFFKLKEEQKILNDKLNKFLNKDILKKIKKKLRNCIFNDCLKEIIEINKEQINVNKNCNYIIGNCQNSLFQNINKLNQNQNKYNVVVDFKTFMRLNYNEKSKDLENDIREKHFEKIQEFSNKDINKLILMVDYVFILNVKEIMKDYFKDKAIIIKPETIKSKNMEEYLLFVLSIDNNPISENKNSLILKDNLFFYDKIDLQKINNNNDFIKYFYEIKAIKEKKDFEYFPFYNAIEENCYFYLTKKTTDYKNGKIAILIADPNIDLEDIIKFNFYENNYNYILIIFYVYFNGLKIENYKSLCNCFVKNTEKFITYNLTPDYIMIIKEKSNVLVLLSEENMKAMIASEEDGRIQFKLRLIRKKENDNIEKENYIINVYNVIDKKIKIIMENVKFIDNKNFNLLINEPFNIIYKYIFENNKKCKITLLSNGNQEIKAKISSQEKSEINDNIISYLSKNKEEKYNVIILANTVENHEMGYNYIKKDNLQIIASHLKKAGKFCVYLFLKNKYLKERINNEIKDIFKNVSIFQYKSDYIFICHN